MKWTTEIILNSRHEWLQAAAAETGNSRFCCGVCGFFISQENPASGILYHLLQKTMILSGVVRAGMLLVEAR